MALYRHRQSAFTGILIAVQILASATAGHTSSAERSCGEPAQVNTIKELFDAIFACWEPPEGGNGMEITLNLALRSNGTLIGEPSIVWLKTGGADEKLKQALITSAMQAVERSLPIPFTKSMGGAVAGRIIRPRFAVK